MDFAASRAAAARFDAALELLGLVAVGRFPRIDRRELGEGPCGLADPVRRRAFVLGKGAKRRLPGAADAVRVEKALPLDRELGILPFEECDRFDLANLELQHLEPRPALAARGFERRQLLAGLPPALGRPGRRVPMRLRLRESIQELERGPGIPELLL